MAVAFCDRCGDAITFNDAEAVCIGDTHFCSDDCAYESGFSRCDHCSSFYNPQIEGIQSGGGAYCSETCAMGDGNAICRACGQWHSVEQDGHIAAFDPENSITSHFCSESCATHFNAFRCEDCGQWFTTFANLTPTGYVCDNCAGEYYNYCDCCGHYVSVDDWDDEHDRCTSCTDRAGSDQHLHRYGFRPTTKFFGDTENDAYPYLGVELETDIADADRSGADARRMDYCEALATLETKPRFWLTSDSSLFCGVEVTSHPMTLAEHIGCGMWESVREAALEFGFSSHDNGRCGLHIHINRSFFGKGEKRQQVGGYNLAMLVSRFEKQLTQFSRRKDNGWCNYGIHAEYLDKHNRHTQSMGMFEKSKHMCEGKRYEHCQCVNFQHDATFEIRIFRGTLRMETLFATLAMAQGLARAAKLHSQTWCEEVTWASLTQYILSDTDDDVAKTALASYMTERGIG